MTLAITAMVQEGQELLVPVLQVIFVNVELKYQSLTMTPQEESAQEDTFVPQDSSPKNVLQVKTSFVTQGCNNNINVIIYLNFTLIV